MTMKPQNIFIMLITLLMLSCPVLAVNVVQFNASNIAVTFTGTWITPANATDDNFNSRATTHPGAAGWAVFYLPETKGFLNATMRSRTSEDPARNDLLPPSCYYLGHLNITIQSAYDATQDSIGVFCRNSTGLQVIYTNGAGDNVAYKDDFYELYVNVTYMGLTNCLPNPASPIYSYDDFSYFETTDACWWVNQPAKNIYPISGRLCYNGTAAAQSFNNYLGGEGHMYSDQVFGEEFLITLSNETSLYLEKALSFLQEDITYHKAYVIDFTETAGIVSLQYIYNDNGTVTSETLCTGCFLPGNQQFVKISVYGPQAVGYTMLNATSGIVQAIQPNTWSIQLGSGAPYFNIPMLESSPITLLPRYSNWDIYTGKFCLDDYFIYKGLVNSPEVVVNISGVPSKQLGEFCTQNWQCFTGFCDFLSKCSKKNWKQSCLSDSECTSNKCNDGYCTQPTLGQNLNAIKDDAVGDDESSSNILSFIIVLFVLAGVAALVLYLGGSPIFALVGGGLAGFFAFMLLTMIGWLSPWILIGLIIFCLAIIAFVFILLKGG